MLDGFSRNAMKKQVEYYNNNRADVDENSPIRAIYANIAWCLVDKERYDEYFNKSDYWAIELRTAARAFSINPDILAKRPIGDTQFRNNRREIYNYLNETHGRKFLLRPGEYNMYLDTDSIYVMLYQSHGGS